MPMNKENLRQITTMNNPWIKKIILLFLLSYFSGVIALSLHHHNNSFLLPTCSICKAKTSFAGTFSKTKVDFTPETAMVCLPLMVLSLIMFGILLNRETVFSQS
jgi:hypothetical protein